MSTSVAPKKPLSAYFCFMSDRRPKLKAEQPDLDHKDVLKVMGKEWGQLTDKDKEKFTALALKDKQRYIKQMEDYTPSSEEVKKSKRGGKKDKKKTKKVEGAPKKALTAFFHFQNTRRVSMKEENPKLAQKDLICKMSEEWKAMDDKTKEKYNEMNKKDKERYEVELKEFESKKESDKDETKDDEESE